MTPSSRDRITVDLHGLKAALFERAIALGVSPSALVRKALASTLGQSASTSNERLGTDSSSIKGDRVRVSLRMSREQALVVFEAARQARLSPGEFVAGLVAGVPALSGTSTRADYAAALIASNAELATLSRNIHHLSTLLRQGSVRPAMVYRAMLDTLDGDVRGHLALASRTLADLQPTRGMTGMSRHRAGV